MSVFSPTRFMPVCGFVGVNLYFSELMNLFSSVIHAFDSMRYWMSWFKMLFGLLSEAHSNSEVSRGKLLTKRRRDVRSERHKPH